MKGVAIADHVRRYRKDSHPQYSWQPTGTAEAPDIGKTTPEFIREMLIPVRTLKPQDYTVARGENENDLRFFRVWLKGRNGIHIKK